MSILRKVEFEQADFMWQYQLRYERDVVAQVRSWRSLGSLTVNFSWVLWITFLHVRSVPQVEAIAALEKFPTPASRLALTDILEQDQCFYKVRMQACFCLAKVCVRVRVRVCMCVFVFVHRERTACDVCVCADSERPGEHLAGATSHEVPVHQDVLL